MNHRKNRRGKKKEKKKNGCSVAFVANRILLRRDRLALWLPNG